MLLTIDIGNTTVAVGGFLGPELRFVRRLPSDRNMDAAACAARMRTLLAEEGAAPQDVEGAVLSSVVPSLTQVAVQAAEALTRRPVRVLGRDLDPGLPTGDYDASNLGMDRLVDCVAALARWRPPLAVFDMGTATTLSVVDREGVFRGGMILPGLRLSVDALSARAAQLPCITFTQPEGLLGTDTVSCMRSGALYGAAAALEGEGVSSLAANLGSDIAELLGKKTLAKGVHIQMTDETVTAELSILVAYGHTIPEVGKAVQDAVKNAVESMTGLEIAAVNVNVGGITFPAAAKA
mgnify:CR=1 FL=1